MSRNRYMIRMTYADGSPGLGFHPTLTAATKAAQSPMHGGRHVAVAEVCERLSSGAEVPIRTFRPTIAVDDHDTIVIFRVDRGIRGSVFALMPEVPADASGGPCTVYEHVGQHGAANYPHCIATSRPAAPWQYGPLLAELTERGYKVVMRRRATHAMHKRRQAEARA